MASPSRAQIEATVALPKYKIEILDSVWIEVDYIESVNGSIDSTSNPDNALSFGTPSNPSASITLENAAYKTDTRIGDSSVIGKKVRISYAFDTSDYIPVFIGVVETIQISGFSATLQLAGILTFLINQKVYTPIYYRKPIATKTTSTSQENPGLANYVAGMINLALWYSGGRPYEQSGINYTEASPNFKFWYSLEQSTIEPDYSWFSGENLLDEIYMLARAAGGQIFQGLDGIVRYIQPLSFNDDSLYGGVFYIFNDTDYIDYSESISKSEDVGALKLTYTPRRIQPVRTIVEDKTPRFVLPNSYIDVELAPEQPVWQYVNLSQAYITDIVKAMLIDNSDVTPTISDISATAARVSLRITNPSTTKSMIVYSIIIQGRPLEAEDELIAQYGSGEPERNLENNVYIQSVDHADRLLRLVFDFYGINKPIVTLNGSQYDPDRYVGELVKVQTQYNTILSGGIATTNTNLYRIIGISHSNTGTTMDITLVEVANLPKRQDMFILGQAYSGGDSKQLSY